MKKRVANPTFRFYPGNKIANERNFFVSDIRQLFQKWLLKQDINWLSHYGHYITVQTFITSKEGLNSPFENSQLEELDRLLKPDYINIMNGVNPVTKLPDSKIPKATV
mgnify:CR=1 FL=1